MSGGFYKYRCKYFYSHNCPNWKWQNNATCTNCLAEGRDTEATTLAHAPDLDFLKELLTTLSPANACTAATAASRAHLLWYLGDLLAIHLGAAHPLVRLHRLLLRSPSPAAALALLRAVVDMARRASQQQQQPAEEDLGRRLVQTLRKAGALDAAAALAAAQLADAERRAGGRGAGAGAGGGCWRRRTRGR